MTLGVIIVVATIALLVVLQALGVLTVRWMDSRTMATPPSPRPKAEAPALNDILRARAKRAMRVQIRHPKHGPSARDRHA